MDDVRPPMPEAGPEPGPEPGSETAEARFKRRLRSSSKPDPVRMRQWQQANREAIDALNAWDERTPLFTDKFRPL